MAGCGEGVGNVGGPAAQEGANLRCDLKRVEGLRDESIRSGVKPHDLVGSLRASRDDDDGDVVRGTESLDEVVAVHARHHDVDKRDIGRVLPKLLESIFPISSGDDVVPAAG